MNFFFDANRYSSVFSKKSGYKPEVADKWLASWRDKDTDVRHDILYKAETNNQAEYGSLLMVLHHIHQNIDSVKAYTDEVIVYGDSQLVCYQISGKYKVKEEDLKPLWLEAVNLIRILWVTHGLTVKVEWIPREINNDALKLTKRLDTPGPEKG